MNKKYNAESIEVLKGLEGVRMRPGMYIGETDNPHHMAYEVVYNSVDEALEGYCTDIKVVIHEKGIEVIDNGRGMPVDLHKTENKPAAEVIMTQLHAGGKFSTSSYKVSGGLHGIGVSAVNALSEQLTLTIHRDGHTHQMKFAYGSVVQPLTKVKPSTQHGTEVFFMPDKKIFQSIQFDTKVLADRFQELAFLNPGLKITMVENGEEAVFYSTDGLTAFAKHLSKGSNYVHPQMIPITGQDRDVKVSAAMVWTESYTETSMHFTNTTLQKHGGTHMMGMRNALTRAVQNYIKTNNTKLNTTITGDDIREGLVYVLSIQISDPQFSSQTKDKLVSEQARTSVEQIVYQHVTEWLEKTPQDANKVISRIVDASHAREAAKKARALSRKQKNGQPNLKVSKNLGNCSEKDPSKCELFIVEGLSAGGCAKQARNRFTQAVLPLQGKVLNVAKASMTKTLNTEILTTLIAALECGIGDEFDSEKIRYHKVIILADGDVDGRHVEVLLYTFFFRYLPGIIEKGYLYTARPPLFGIVTKKGKVFLRNDQALLTYILQRGTKDTTIETTSGPLKDTHLIDYLSAVQRIYTSCTSLPLKTAITYKLVQPNLTHDVLRQISDLLQQTQPGEWSINAQDTTCTFSQQYHGNIIDHTVDLLQTEELTKYTNFVQTWGHAWGPNLKHERYNLLNPFQFFDEIYKSGTRGIEIQRYKGLGEMNAEDLASTAMKDYYQIHLDSLENASLICEQLMGENVEPRKKFIEEYSQTAILDV